jgi:hypothetical protein
VLSPLLVGLGVFLLALAVLLPTVVVPRLEKVPLDTYQVSRATGTTSYLNPTTLDFVDQDEATVTRIVRGDVEASGEDVAIFDQTQTLETGQMDEPLDVVAERVVFDRSTGEGTGGRGDRPSHEDAYAIKLPFNVQRRDYEFHEPAAGEAFPVSFQRETKVNGLTVYEFRGEIPETVTGEQGVPGSLLGAPDVSSVFAEEVYSNAGRTLLVEPRTGSIVSTTSAPRRTFRPSSIDAGKGAEETTIFEAELSASEETVAQLVADAKDAKNGLDLVGRTLPLLLGVLGALSLLAGILLLLRRSRDGYDGAHAADSRTGEY